MHIWVWVFETKIPNKYFQLNVSLGILRLIMSSHKGDTIYLFSKYSKTVKMGEWTAYILFKNLKSFIIPS